MTSLHTVSVSTLRLNPGAGQLVTLPDRNGGLQGRPPLTVGCGPWSLGGQESRSPLGRGQGRWSSGGLRKPQAWIPGHE